MANGTTLTCACSGCGIVYNHETKKYTILCCGSITEMSVKSQTEPPNPPPRHHLQVDLAGCTRLEAAQLLQRAAPGRIKIDASLDALEKRVTFKATMPLADLSKKLRLDSPSTTRK